MTLTVSIDKGTDPAKASTFRLEEAIHRLSHWLPTQGPIKDFIHHNTLHAFQDRPFHDALATAGQLFGSRDYLALDTYRRLEREGAISPAGLARAFERFEIPEAERAQWLDRLRTETVVPPKRPGYAQAGLRRAWHRTLPLDLDGLVHPVLFRLLGSFLDQGIGLWRMPHADRLSFWECVRSLMEESWFPFVPLNRKECREILTLSPETAALRCLERMVGKVELYEPYLLEMLLAHPGWSGMVYMVETNPGSLLAPRQISLLDLVAVDLLLEYGWLLKKRGNDFSPVAYHFPQPVLPSPPTLVPEEARATELLRMWHEAYEWTLHESMLGKLETFHATAPAAAPEPFVQAFFCIDDRECSLRRHLETVEPQISTFGTAGFFGLDFMFQGANSAHPIQHCPVVVKPQHLVREVSALPGEKNGRVKRPRLSDLLHAELPRHTNTLFRGWLLTQVLGVSASLHLAMRVFRPGASLLTDRKMTRVEPPTELQLIRETEEKSPQGLWQGYTIPELVERVYNTFRSAGLVDHFQDLVVMVAHGSTSANNPHFAAYDCGACSGRPGAPNARAFAWVANHPEIRKGLREKGMLIPDSTHVLGAIHDTSRDEIRYFDVGGLPTTHKEKLARFHRAMRTALENNAQERCRRFEMVPADITPAAAHRHVQERSLSIFEPRPELNHANNAFAIVGRRSLTRGLSFDRRAFLNSYDPTRDPEGVILTGILNAVIPVCGGINLEYFFSRMDNEYYGAGTKLPHNVVSLIGVANGVEGDLRTGLPSQMIELHDPIRLLVLVEQEPEVALKAVTRNPANYEWVQNEWVYYAAFSPTTRRAYLLEKGTWKSLDGRSL